MSSLLSLIMIASVVGTALVIFLALLKPITGRVFSKAWHYYVGLIPVFFYLGGVRLVNMLVRLAWPSGIHTDAAAGLSETLPIMGNPDIYISTAASSAFSDVFYAQGGMGFSTPYAGWSLTDSLQSGAAWLSGLFRIELAPGLAIFLFAAWALGAILFTAISIQRYRAYRREILLNSRICASIDSPVPVVISQKATTPMVIGFIQPLIVLPKMDLSRRELNMILAHELAHFRRKDVWLKLLILLIRAIHWFNPAVHYFNRYMHDLCELSCDEKVVMEMSTSERKLYGETILSMLQQATAQRSLICASGLCNSQKNVKRRLTDMLNVKKMRKITVALSLALALVIVGVGGIVAHGFRSDPNNGEDYYAEAYDEAYDEATEDVMHMYPEESEEPADGDEYAYLEDPMDSEDDYYIYPVEEPEDYDAVEDSEPYEEPEEYIPLDELADALVVAAPMIISADEVVSGNFLVESEMTVYGLVNGIITVETGGLLTIAGSGQVNGTVIVSGKAYLTDSGLITGAGTRGVTINPGGVFEMTSGFIRGNSFYGDGGGVWMRGGSFIMHCGLIEGNTSYNGRGGGVYVDYDSMFNMYGGYIRGNNAHCFGERYIWCDDYGYRSYCG